MEYAMLELLVTLRKIPQRNAHYWLIHDPAQQQLAVDARKKGWVIKAKVDGRKIGEPDPHAYRLTKPGREALYAELERKARDAVA